MKYNEAVKIKPQSATAWLVTLPSGQQLIEVWCVDAQIEDVHKSCLSTWDKFELKKVDVGVFALSKILHAYSGDARSVNQDWDMGL